MAKNEIDFKRWFKQQWAPYKSSSIEYGLGGDAGFPDQVLLLPGRGWVPVEFKIATIKKGLLFSKEIRPAQIAWHREMRKADAPCAFLFGVASTNGWLSYVGIWEELEHWKKGLTINMDVGALPLDGKAFREALEEYLGELM